MVFLSYILLQIAKNNKMPVGDRQMAVNIAEDLTPEFSQLANSIKLKFLQISAANEEIKVATESLSGMVAPMKEKEIQKRMEAITAQATNITLGLKGEFEKVEDLIKKQVINEGDEPETRAIIFKRNALVDEFREVIIKHQETVQAYKTKVRQKMVRMISIMDPTFKEEECDDPLALEKMIMEKTLGKPALQVQYRVQDIQDKYADILKLERSVQLTYKLLTEISFLVESQGRDLDTIESHLNEAKKYIQKTEKNLLAQKKDHQKSRKKMCCIVLIGLIIVGVIATPIIMKIVKSKQQ